jgi:hypothetical protein
VETKKISRILTFDLMRGYFLVAIILDHLAYFPNGLDWWGGRGNLYVSAAEGFFLISGIVLGVVRGRKLAEKPFAVAAKLLLQRGVQLYITAVVLMLLFTFIGWMFIDNPGLKAGIRPLTEDVWSVIWGGLTFNYIYGWADYLRLYAIFLFASPIALWLLRRGLWYVLLAVSVWIWSQYSNSPLETAELSQVYSWQLIFFSGLTIGYYLTPIRQWWSSITPVIRNTVIAVTVSIAAITMLANFIIVEGATLFGGFSQTLTNLNNTFAPYFIKEELPIARLVLFVIWFGAGFWLFSRFEQYIVKYFGWLLLPFGTNSLYVYILHAVMVFGAHLVIKDPTPYLLVNFTLSAVIIGIILLAVRAKFLMKIIPR